MTILRAGGDTRARGAVYTLPDNIDHDAREYLSSLPLLILVPSISVSLAPIPTPLHVPRRSRRPKCQSIKLDNYHLYVSTDNFNECMMAHNGKNYDNLLQYLKPAGPDEEYNKSDISF
jgi:hypothetical protein